MEVIGIRMQQKPSDPGDPARRDNLYEARSDGTTHGSQKVHARSTSLMLEAQKLPWAAGGLVALGVGAIVGLSRAATPKR